MFIQVLEGGREEVCELFGAIMSDKRHGGVRILVYEEISERRFGGWNMGQVNMTKVNPALLLKYSDRAVLNPFSSPGRASMTLLDELIATGSVLSRGS
jgi:hypothetical protein